MKVRANDCLPARSFSLPGSECRILACKLLKEAKVRMVRSKPGLLSTFGRELWRCKKYTKTGSWMSKHLKKGKLTHSTLKQMVESGILMGSSYALLEAMKFLKPED